MFPCTISKAATVDVICNGEGPTRNGAVQLVSNQPIKNDTEPNFLLCPAYNGFQLTEQDI